MVEGMSRGEGNAKEDLEGDWFAWSGCGDEATSGLLHTLAPRKEATPGGGEAPLADLIVRAPPEWIKVDGYEEALPSMLHPP